MFNIRNIRKTQVTRTQGTKIAPDGLKGRVFEMSLANLRMMKLHLENSSQLLRVFRAKIACLVFIALILTHDKMFHVQKIVAHD